MNEDVSDTELVEKVLEGDSKAFDTIVLRYQGKTNAIISRFVDDRALVSDLSQEVFFKVFRSLGQFKHNSSFYTWLYRIIINTIKNHLRLQTKYTTGIDLEYSFAELWTGKYRLRDYTSPENVLLCDEMHHAMLMAFQNLPEELRLSIVLREMDGLSYDDIAKQMDCPVGTVRSRIFRARNVIDQHIKPFLK